MYSSIAVTVSQSRVNEKVAWIGDKAECTWMELFCILKCSWSLFVCYDARLTLTFMEPTGVCVCVRLRTLLRSFRALV